MSERPFRAATGAKPLSDLQENMPTLQAETRGVSRAYRCQCGRAVFFRNSVCLACKTPLGYEPYLRAHLSAGSRTGALDVDQPVYQATTDDQGVFPPATMRAILYSEPPPEVTSLDGSFRINNVYPGKYKIVAVSPGSPYFLDSVRMGDRELLGQFVDLVSATLPVEIKFESEGGGIRGRVEGCGSGTVVLAPQDSALQEPQFVQTTRCGDQGRFQFANVRPGDYYAFAFDQWGGAAELLSGLDPSLVNKAVRVRVERAAFGNIDLRITSRNQ